MGKLERYNLDYDEKFKSKCLEYCLDVNYEIYNYTIILKAPIKDVYVLFDSHYNTIGIHKVEPANMHLTMEEISELYTNAYNLVDEKKGHCFSYPFQNLSLKEIIDISNRVYFDLVGYSYKMYFNGDYVIRENNEDYFNLLLYFKFLGKQIKQYFLNAYQMKIMGFDYPNIYEYVNRLIANINMCIDDNIKNNHITEPCDIRNYLGQIEQNIENTQKHLLNSIINLLTEDKGFEISWRDRLDPINQELKDLSELSNKLVEFLKFQRKKDLDWVNIKTIDLSSLLGPSIKETKAPTLKKIQSTEKR